MMSIQYLKREFVCVDPLDGQECEIQQDLLSTPIVLPEINGVLDLYQNSIVTVQIFGQLLRFALPKSVCEYELIYAQMLTHIKTSTSTKPTP